MRPDLGRVPLNRKKRNIAVTAIALGLGAPIGVVAFTTSAPSPSARAVEPLPRGVVEAGPIASTWTRRAAHIVAERVDLVALGEHTHANWIFFRLPFDTSSDRVRAVQITMGASIDPDVSAARVLGRCVTYKRFGPLSTWALYTSGGVGQSLPFWRHPSPPTDDPTILALNVPTRVANYVSCGWEGSETLGVSSTWFADLVWEFR